MGGNLQQTEKPRSAAAFLVSCVLLLLACAGFVALGDWQLHRLAWKEALIERVQKRLAAPPEPPPPRTGWAALSRDDDYRQLCLDGVYDHGRETLVQAVTRLGPGWWVLTPLRQDNGDTVLVNRGYVDDAHRDPASRAAGQVGGAAHVCGLLRSSEPGGAFLRHNDPAAGRWYSRDVGAIAAARGLPAADTAPYFLDADDQPNPGRWPVGGLTVVQFRNAHLSYALTWYGLALLCGLGLVTVVRHRRRQR